MGNEGQDLRTFLEHSCAEVQELLRVASKLVLEVRASHYWTTYGIEVLGSLSNIGNNLHKLLDGCAPHWEEGQQIFARLEAQKLWKTAIGVYQAIPPVAAKFNDQLDKRRKQRIMNQTYDELPESTAEQIQQDLTTFTLKFGEIKDLFEGLSDKVAGVPDKLVPAQAPQHSGNGIPAAPQAVPAAVAQVVNAVQQVPSVPPTPIPPEEQAQSTLPPAAESAPQAAAPAEQSGLQQTEPGIWTILSPKPGSGQGGQGGQSGG